MISHYEQNENAFYQFVLSVNRVHGDSVNNRVARGELRETVSFVSPRPSVLVRGETKIAVSSGTSH